MRTTRPFAILLGLVALIGGAFADKASATPPARQQFSVAGFTTTIGSLCSFPIELTVLVGDVDETDYFHGGQLVAVHQHVVEQDSFSANGKTLTTHLYTGNLDVTFDASGNPTVVGEGVFEMVPLPGGGLFLAAGKTTFQGGVAFIPNKGAVVNLDGFCAALSP